MKNTKHKTGKKQARKTRKHQGGKTRREEIVVTFGRQHTNPDIDSIVQVIKGPESNNNSENRGEYMSNFVSSVAKKFEEELAVMMKGAPDVKVKQKVYKLIYHDNDAPMESNSAKSVKCK